MGKKSVDKDQYVKRDTMLLVAVVCVVVGFVGGTVFGIYKSSSIAPLPAQEKQTAADQEMEEATVAETIRNPENVAAWIQLGNLDFDSGRNQEAIAAYEKAIALKPKDANVITDLGVMYRRSDQPEKAVKAFERAIQADPKHEIARFNKGIVLLHDLNDKNGALRVWEELLEINPIAMAPNGQTLEELIRHFKDHE